MLRLPKIGVLLFFGWLATVAAWAEGFAPQAVRVTGVPAAARRFWSASPTSDGWIAASADGLVRQSGGTWVLDRPPQGGEVKVVVPAAGQIVVAGTGFCWRWQEGAWQATGLTDNFRTGVATGETALIAGRRAVYAFDRAGNGAPRQVMTFTQDTNAVVHVIGGRALLFTGPETFIWEDGKFRPAGLDFKWSPGAPTFLAEDGRGGFVSAARRGLVRGGPGGETGLLWPDLWAKLLPRGVTGVALLDDTVVIATHLDGVAAYALDTGEPRWALPPAAFEGNVYFIRGLPDGILVGSSESLYVVPAPTRAEFATLPKDDIYFVTRTPAGAVVGGASGVVFSDGRPTTLTGRIVSLLALPSGELVQGEFGQLRWQGKELKLPDAREVTALAALGDGRLAVLQPSGVALVDAAGRTTSLSLPSAGYALASTHDGGVLVGTATGAYAFGQDGVARGNFGTGVTQVFPTAASAMAVDSAGHWFDERGRRLGRLPFRELLSATEWDGRLCLLGRFADGRIELGFVDTTTAAWQPLDLPLTNSPVAILGDIAGLLVIAPGKVMAVKSAAPHELPPLVARWRKGGQPWDHALPLAATEDTVELDLLPPRLSPWASPGYAVRVGSGEWQDYAPGARVALPRLAWDRTEVTVRAERAGRETHATYALVRLRPWWARWPGFVLAGSALSLAGYGTLRWRTSRLQRRNRELEQIVATRTAELRQAQRAREEFFSTLSHELRNPLNGVVGLCEMLAEAPADAVAPRERLFVRTLRGCAEQLRSMLDDVLDFARIDRGDIELRPTDFELGPTVEGAARAVDVALAQCHLELPPATHWLCGDSGKLRQIVTNLVSNALKHGVPPGARLTARLTPSPAEPSVLTLDLVVASTGPTLPATELARIFHGFSRGTEALRRHLPGSGLGLAVSRRLAVAMGGQLTATSHEGLTEFRLQLPFAPGLAGSGALAPIPSAANEVTPARGLVLAIEDEPYNRLVLGHHLAGLGYAVDWAEDGATARRHAQSRRYDLILTDYLLPDATGVELAHEFLTTLPAPRPPIVAITAYATAEKIAEARAAGIAAVLTKPVSRDQLAAALAGFAPSTSALSPASDTDALAHDFSPLLHLPDGRRTLAEYAAHLPLAWTALLGRLAESPPAAAAAAHALRAQVLAVHAEEIAAQLALLETAARAGDHTTAQRLTAVIGPMLATLAASARTAALAQARSD